MPSAVSKCTTDEDPKCADSQESTLYLEIASLAATEAVALALAARNVPFLPAGLQKLVLNGITGFVNAHVNYLENSIGACKPP